MRAVVCVVVWVCPVFVCACVFEWLFMLLYVGLLCVCVFVYLLCQSNSCVFACVFAVCGVLVLFVVVNLRLYFCLSCCV